MTVPLIEDPAPVSTGPYGAMVDAEAAAIAQIQAQLVAAVFALWAAFEAEEAFWSGDSVSRWATRAGSLVVAAQRQVGLVTEAYLRQQFRQMGEPLPAGRIVDLPRDLRLGTEVEEVYQRPVRQVRYLVSREAPTSTVDQDVVDLTVDTDDDMVRALRQARERLEKLLDDDIQIAHTTASQQVMYATDEKVIGYRRIIHPELGNVCGLCIAAADRIYSKKDLQPIHKRCKCTTMPVVVGADPGLSLNAEDLLRLYDAAGGTGAAALKSIRVEVKQNGELGPILTRAGVEIKQVDEMLEQLSPRAREQRRDSILRQIESLRAVENKTEWLEDRLSYLESLPA